MNNPARKRTTANVRHRFINLPDDVVRAIARVHPSVAARLASVNRRHRAVAGNVLKKQRRRAARLGRAWRNNVMGGLRLRRVLRSLREIGMIVSQPDRQAKRHLAHALGWTVHPGATVDFMNMPPIHTDTHYTIAASMSSFSDSVLFVMLRDNQRVRGMRIWFHPNTPPHRSEEQEPPEVPELFRIIRDAWHVMFNPDGNLAPRPSPYDMRVTRRDLELKPKETALLKRVGAAPSRFPLKRRARQQR